MIDARRFESRCNVLGTLQSVMNAAARLTVGAQLHDHITPLLADRHWLRIPQRIQYKLCVLVFNYLHGTAPRYLQEVICPVENIEPRRRLRSASSTDLTVPATRRSTLGDHAFVMAGPHHLTLLSAHWKRICIFRAIFNVLLWHFYSVLEVFFLLHFTAL